MKRLALMLLFIIKIKGQSIFIESPYIKFDTCLISYLESGYTYGGHPAGEENQYSLTIKRLLDTGTKIVMKFDSEVSVVEMDSLTANSAGISVLEKSCTIIVYKKFFPLKVTVKGLVNGKVPYLKSLLINGVEECRSFVMGSLNNMVEDLRLARQVRSSLTDHDCGRRILDFTELIVNGEATKPGQWPWHVALYRHEGTNSSYICGGTLISKLFVITAAHCVTINNAAVVPDILSVVLGKYHLVGGDVSSEERKVFSVIVHEEFRSPLYTDNDIALLKLMTEAVYSAYIQPACLWRTSSLDSFSMSTDQIMGTVVGWGVSEIAEDIQPSELKQATLPMVSEAKCIKSNPAFYAPLLNNEKKFCAGWNNGTSPCSGDSGGGFLVYVPKTPRNAAAWYIRGVVSYARTVNKKCDPNQYVAFTDLSKYETWIRTNSYDKVSCRA